MEISGSASKGFFKYMQPMRVFNSYTNFGLTVGIRAWCDTFGVSSSYTLRGVASKSPVNHFVNVQRMRDPTSCWTFQI